MDNENDILLNDIQNHIAKLGYASISSIMARFQLSEYLVKKFFHNMVSDGLLEDTEDGDLYDLSINKELNMKTYFTADWHLGESRIGINGGLDLFFRPFSSIAEQNATIMDNLYSEYFQNSLRTNYKLFELVNNMGGEMTSYPEKIT